MLYFEKISSVLYRLFFAKLLYILLFSIQRNYLILLDIKLQYQNFEAFIKERKSLLRESKQFSSYLYKNKNINIKIKIKI